MLALKEGAPSAEAEGVGLCKCVLWSVMDASAFFSGAVRASLQEGSRSLLAKV